MTRRIDTLRAEVATLDEAHADLLGKRDDAEREARAARRELELLADREADAAVGDADPAAVAKERARWQNELARADETIEHVARVLPRLESKLADARRRILEAEHDEQAAALVVRQKELAATAAVLGEHLAGTVSVACDLVEAREATAELRGAVQRLASELGLDPPQTISEPGWLPAGWQVLVELLQGQPSLALVHFFGRDLRGAFAGGGPINPPAAPAAAPIEDSGKALRRVAERLARLSTGHARFPATLGELADLEGSHLGEQVSVCATIRAALRLLEAHDQEAVLAEASRLRGEAAAAFDQEQAGVRVPVAR